MVKFAYLDVDIDGRRAAHALCCEFVESCDLKYGFSSKIVAELGGGEKKQVKSFFAGDYEWSQRAPGRVALKPAPHERIVFELYDGAAPLAVENFRKLCTGEKGLGKCGKPLRYEGSAFHRVVPGFMCQAGDIVMGTGTGGESVFDGKKFKDEAAGLKLRHGGRGVLSMGNSGKNANTSQFFVTFAERKALDGKHVVFGRVAPGHAESWAVLDAIEAVEVEGGGSEVPRVRGEIAGAGVLPDDWAPPPPEAAGAGQEGAGGGGAGGGGAAAAGALKAAQAAAKVKVKAGAGAKKKK